MLLAVGSSIIEFDAEDKALTWEQILFFKTDTKIDYFGMLPSVFLDSFV